MANLNPGDELRLVREAKRLRLAKKLFHRSMHLTAGAAVFGMGAAFLIVRNGAMPGALFLLVLSIALHIAAGRMVRRGKEML